MPVGASSVRTFCEHDLDAVVRRESETPVYAGAPEVGGTGLEPVTPACRACPANGGQATRMDKPSSDAACSHRLIALTGHDKTCVADALLTQFGF
jgi:hypothetical protein